VNELGYTQNYFIIAVAWQPLETVVRVATEQVVGFTTIDINSIFH
jgi:hypothetical protein